MCLYRLIIVSKSKEPKISSFSRQDLVYKNKAELKSTINSSSEVDVALTSDSCDNMTLDSPYVSKCLVDSDTNKIKIKRPDVMRKHMTRLYDELLSTNKNCMYIGEDVEHGGYYLVTDGLKKKHPGK